MTRSKEPLIISNSQGLYCPQGNFYVDPLRPVHRALITHAHSDHARSGSESYLTVQDGLHVLRSRIGKSANIETIKYGERRTINGVSVSFHSAGHVLGSAQIRIEYKGEVCVVSGDYKTRTDPTCAPFEPVECNTFITESTFGLPIYRWPDPSIVAHELNEWWANNRNNGRTSVVLAYSFGKAQRIMKMLDASIGPIYVHSTVDKLNKEYIASGVSFPEYGSLGDLRSTAILPLLKGSLIIAPPSAATNEWIKMLGDYQTAFASGWMRVRANRKSNSVDRGFVLSDHADWTELLQVIGASKAEEVVVAHGYVRPLIKHLQARGIKARTFRRQGQGFYSRPPAAPATEVEN